MADKSTSPVQKVVKKVKEILADKVTIALGHRVKDVSIGIEGFVHAIIERDTGTLRYQIQCDPEDGSNKAGEAWDVDAIMVEYIGPGQSDRAVPVTVKHDHIQLGGKVIDETSGFKGVTIERLFFMNGCVYFNVQGPVNPETGAQGYITPIPVQRLTMIQPPKKPAVTASKEEPGGPATRSVRM